MAGNRKAFLVHTDLLKMCEGWSYKQLGELYIAQLRYANGLDVEITDLKVQFVWSIVKSQMDKDNEKYKKRCRKA